MIARNFYNWQGMNQRDVAFEQANGDESRLRCHEVRFNYDHARAAIACM